MQLLQLEILWVHVIIRVTFTTIRCTWVIQWVAIRNKSIYINLDKNGMFDLPETKCSPQIFECGLGRDQRPVPVSVLSLCKLAASRHLTYVSTFILDGKAVKTNTWLFHYIILASNNTTVVYQSQTDRTEN